MLHLTPFSIILPLVLFMAYKSISDKNDTKKEYDVKVDLENKIDELNKKID